VDLPFTSFVTDNEKAFRHWVSGNEIAAIKEDPNYAYAYLGELGDAFSYGLGDNYKKHLIKEGLERMNKLPERDQLKFKAFYFLAKGEKENAIAAYERFVEFNPGDPKVLRSYINFLARNGFYDEAFELSRSEFNKRFDEGYGTLMLRLALSVANPDRLKQFTRDAERTKLLIPDDFYSIMMAQVDIARGDLVSARQGFQEALLDKPLYNTLDSLIKVVDFLEEVDEKKHNNFIESIEGTYLHETSEQTVVFKKYNNMVVQFWGGQMPHWSLPINENTIYYCQPYYESQYQDRWTFTEGSHGQILKATFDWQRSFDRAPFKNVKFKAIPELLEAMDAFRWNDYDRADSLFRIVYEYDTGYYFVQNYIDAINYSTNKDVLRLPNLLHGKQLISDENENWYLSFSFDDEIFQVNYSGNVPHRIYPIDDLWVMDTYNKDYKYKVVQSDANLSVEVHAYYNGPNEYRKWRTYHASD
jgi:hypothetical protein